MKLRTLAFIASILFLEAIPLVAQAIQPAGYKIAVFDSEALGDPKSGVKRLAAAYQQLEIEIKPRKDEITTLRAKYDALVKSIGETQKIADPKTIQAKADEADLVRRDIEQKQQEGQTLLDKRAKEVTGPIYEAINIALKDYAKQRGIDLVFDLSKVQGTLMVVNEATDITQAFINDYNAKNPSAGAGVPIK